MADRVEPLTPEEQAILQRMDTTTKRALGDTYCSYCFECLPCPEDIHIPEVLRPRNMAKACDWWSSAGSATTCLATGDIGSPVSKRTPAPIAGIACPVAL